MPPHTIVPLFDKWNSDWYRDIKRQFTGGPSIVFHRYAEVGVTRIGNGDNEDAICEEILGYDKNSLVGFVKSQRLLNFMFLLLM